MADLLVSTPWFSLAICLALYTVDHLLSLYEVHLYRAGADVFLELDGAYRRPDSFAEGVTGRWYLAPRFWLVLVTLALAVPVLWQSLINYYRRPEAFTFLLGGLVLVWAAGLVGQLRNITLYRKARFNANLVGKLHYSRRLLLFISSSELLGFTIVYLLGFIVTGSWFFLGGAFSCFVASRRSRDLALVR